MNKEGKQKMGQYVKAQTLARQLDMSPRYVKDRVKRGELVGYRVGNEILVSIDSVHSYLERRRVAPPQ